MAYTTAPSWPANFPIPSIAGSSQPATGASRERSPADDCDASPRPTGSRARSTLELLALERAPNEAESEADCVELIDGRLPLAEVLEDELLLSCAFAPTHAEPGCEGAKPTSAAPLPEERRRPFANLDQLLKGRDDE